MLVHNAGVSFPGRVAESTVDEWRTTFDVNVVGAVAVTLALLPALRRAHGQVVFINSGAGRTASADMASYSASKFALRAFADSLRESEPALRVTTVYPGRTDTDMQRELVSFEGGEYDADRFLRPDTVARAVAQAMATPPDGHLHEVVLRPRGGDDRTWGRCLDDQVDQPPGDHDHLLRCGAGQERLHLLVGQRRGLHARRASASAATVIRPRTLPLTCTGYSTVSSTR